MAYLCHLRHLWCRQIYQLCYLHQLPHLLRLTQPQPWRRGQLLL
jgi:hypothetical protein